MNEDEAIQKNAMQLEIQELKAENKRLRELLKLHKIPYQPTPEPRSNESVTKFSSSEIKMALYLSLFRGRTDVYAARWQNKAVSPAIHLPVLMNGKEIFAVNLKANVLPATIKRINHLTKM